MCLFPITLLPIRRKNGIGKVIIFVNQQVNARAVRTADVFLKSRQHLSRIGFIRIDNLPNITAQQVLVFQDEILHHHAAILAERTLHILQLRTDCREVESQNHVLVVLFRRMLAYIQFSEYLFKTIRIINTIIRFQHGQKQ